MTGLLRGSRAGWARLADVWFQRYVVPTSLAFKVLFPVLVITVVLAGVLGAIVDVRVQSTVRGEYEEAADSTAAGVMAVYFGGPSAAQLDSYLRTIVDTSPDLVNVRIVGVDSPNSVLASSNPGEIGRPAPLEPVQSQAAKSGQPLEDLDDGATFETLEPLIYEGRLHGAVMVTTSKTGMLAAAHAIALTVGLAALAAIIVESLLVSLVIHFGVSRRALRVERAIEAVANGDVSTRLYEGQEKPGRDEIFNLARSVDHMIGQLDGRQRGEALIRMIAQSAMQGAGPDALVDDSLTALREVLGLESCMFVSAQEDGKFVRVVHGRHVRETKSNPPVWVLALARRAIESQCAVVSDRLGMNSEFAPAAGSNWPAQAAIVPLPRALGQGQAIIAVAPAGEKLPEGGLAVLEAVGAVIAEAEHMRAAQEARAESAVKSRIMSTLSHEMRNPLNSILGFTGLLLAPGNTNLSDKQRRQLGFVHSSASSMQALVNNYLDLAKVRSGGISERREPVTLEPLVKDLVAKIEPAATAKNVTIRTSVAAGASAYCDAAHLRGSLSNLLSNAVRFTPPGGRVYVRARVDNDRCRIAVSDTGVGILAESKPNILTEFAKIDAGEMASAKGTGLGLALTKALVTAMNGTIKVYSRRGRGTTVVIVIPAGVLALENVTAA